METQSESDGSDTEHFSDAISNRGDEPRSNNVGAALTTDQDKSINNATTTKNDNATKVAQKPDHLGAINDKEISTVNSNTMIQTFVPYKSSKSNSDKDVIRRIKNTMSTVEQNEKVKPLQELRNY